jgi:hypothetical protein
MIATLPRTPARTTLPRTFDASFELPVPVARPLLDVLDGLVSIGHQAWMRCPGSPVLQ